MPKEGIMRRQTAEESGRDPYKAFIRSQSASAAAKRGFPPATLLGWDERLEKVRAGLARAFGRMPDPPCPLAPELLGTLVRKGYAIERLTFQSRLGVRVTANLYRPDPVEQPCPAVLSVHGHWAWARMDPHVQPRCIGLAKLGYVVLCVDAFGAGERAIDPGPGRYHGGLIGASLLPVGTPLIGLQVNDNRRAVDYLISRPEVDPGRLAITGASGGGNQTLYAGATDERLKAVIPVCGVGTYDAYLTTACCVCELNVGGAAYATTADLLAMVAPRALLVISATRDAEQFSVAEAAKSVARATERFRSLGAEAKVRHLAVDSGHDYNAPMREAMYGWVEKWLCGRGNGDPIKEPDLQVEEIAALRCYPDGRSRPKTIVTIPEFVYKEGIERLAALPKPPDHKEHWNAEVERMRSTLKDQILGGLPPRGTLAVKSFANKDSVSYRITTESGIRSTGVATVPAGARGGTAIIAIPGSRTQPIAGRTVAELSRPWLESGFATLAVTDSRFTPLEVTNVGPVAGVADHNPAEWGLWVNRPLLGQWTWDLIRWVDFLDEQARIAGSSGGEAWMPARPYVVFGLGAMCLPAILAGGLDGRVDGVACEDCLVSFVGREGKRWCGHPMGLLAPNILNLGDVGHVAALLAPRPFVLAGAIEPDGEPATASRIRAAFEFTKQIYRLLGAIDRVKVGEGSDLRIFTGKS
jgi:dienelactone hydrolase